MAPNHGKYAEWLEADGLGGFASGTVSGTRTRRYHALLLTAATPPTGRLVLVNGFDACVTTAAGTFALISQAYAPNVMHPDGSLRIESFEPEPWPRWTFRLEDGSTVEQEIFVPKGGSVVAVSWRWRDPDPSSRPTKTRGEERREGRIGGPFGHNGAPAVAGIVSTPAVAGAGSAPASSPSRSWLTVRPFFSGRDVHAMHHENPHFRFEPVMSDGIRMWRPYEGVPGILVETNGEYVHQPDWYRNFLYAEERERGLDFTEDLASPGIFRFDLTRDEAVWILAAEGFEGGLLESSSVSLPREKASEIDSSSVRTAAPNGRANDSPGVGDRAATLLERLRTAERSRRSLFTSRLGRAADAYIVRRGRGLTIVAGYPWFTDWGRDTFIALRGLCLAVGRLDMARAILVQWAGTVSEGMLPNRFPDGRSAPDYNSVDASLWFVVAIHDFLNASAAAGEHMSVDTLATLLSAVDAILAAYTRGARHGIHADGDGLLASGAPGVQLTWMDAKVDGRVVTPRIGKPVEIQALWLNSLKIASGRSSRWAALFERGFASFQVRFWSAERGHLFDVVDVDHNLGAVDATFRPNQILAVGGLPIPLLEGDRARRVVDEVERRLVTTLGLRSLARDEPGYVPRYEGGPRQRDGSYHQGTVWPWLMGPFVEAWVRVRGDSPVARREARERFLEPLLRSLDRAGIGHLPEIADGDPPHRPRGCPFQAWSVGEALRLDRVVLAQGKPDRDSP